MQRQPISEEELKDEEENIQAEKFPGNITQVTQQISTSINALRGGGQPLPDTTRRFFEPRFGVDFSKVQVHTNPQAEDMAKNINSRAFTMGRNIVFGQGQYAPDTSSGKRLLAHELSHVIQQGKSAALNNQVQRTVSSRSRCRSSTNGAPPAPEIFLLLTEVLVGSHLTGAMLLLSFDIRSLQAGNIPQNSSSFNAYLERFGPPEQLRNRRFRDRFSGSQFVTEEEAMAAELTQLKNRLIHIQNFFNNPIRYICASERGRLTIGRCIDRCVDRNGEAFAWVCRSGGAARTIVICPDFWTMPGNDRAIGLIHEAVHLIFGFGDPAGASMTTRRRARNPVCYSGFVASVSGSNPPDIDCPPV